MAEIKLTQEMLEKAKQAKSAEELLALAKENGIELTGEKAKEIYEKLTSEDLADEELDNVAGGISDYAPMVGRPIIC